MADLERSIKVLLLGEDYNLDRTLKNTSKDFDKFSQNVQDATAPLADIGKKAVMVEAALIAMAVGGLAYAGKKAADFDSQFREITTLLDDTGAGVQQFRSDIIAYAQDSTKSIEDINGAIYSAISAGVDYEDALGSLADAEQLAVGTKADLESSTKTLVSTLNAYGASSEEAGAYAEILFETVKNGQTTMADLSGKIANVTSIAANSGVEFDELAAAIAGTTSTGVRTEATITGIRQAISNIIKPTAQAADMAEKLGIQFNAQALEADGLTGILTSVKEATGGNTEQMAQLFGSVEALNVVMALTGEGAEKFASTLEATSRQTGTLSTAYEKMADDVKLQTQTLWNNVEATLISVGDRVISSFEGVPGAASELFKGIKESVDTGAFDEIFNAIDRFADNFKGTLEDLAETAPEALERVDFSGLIESFENLGDELNDALDNLLGGDIDLSTVEGVEEAIQRVINLFQGLTNFTSGFISGIQPMIEVLGNLGEAAGEAGDKGADLAGTIAGLSQTVNTALGFLDGFKGMLLAIGGTAFGFNQIAALTVNLGTISKMSGILPRALFGGIAIGAFVGAVEATQAGINGIKDALPGMESDGKGAFESLIDSGNEFNRSVLNIVDVLTGKRDWWTGELKGEVSDVASVFGQKGGDIEKDIRDIGLKWIDVDAAVKDNPVEPKVKPGAIDYVTKELEEVEEIASKKYEPEVIINVNDDGSIELIENQLASIDDTKVEAEAGVDVDDFKKAMDAIEPMISGYYETIQSQVEWEAKLEIAEVEANARKVEAIMEGVTASVETAGEVLAGIFGNLDDLQDIYFSRFEIQDLIEEQTDIQRRGLEVQERLADAQISYMNARKRRLDSDEPLITVSGDGLQPHLEAIMFDVLGAVQTRASEEYDNFLLGIE